jgi:hypothetical protein
MVDKLQVHFLTGSPLYELATFERLWRAFAAPIVGAKRWGEVQRTTEPFTPDATQARRSLRWTRFLFVDGDGFQTMISSYASMYSITTWLRSTNVAKPAARAAWLAWITQLFESLPVLFGFAAMGAEYDAKHVEETADSKGWLGSSLAEHEKFLPGIYWLTVFGRELASALPVTRVDTIPGVLVHPLAGDQVMVLLDEPPVPKSMAARLTREREIAAMIGNEYFFDRDDPGRQHRNVPAFVDELSRLQRTPLPPEALPGS